MKQIGTHRELWCVMELACQITGKGREGPGKKMAMPMENNETESLQYNIIKLTLDDKRN